MNILVTLNSGLGADTGPNFNLTTNVGSVIPSTVSKSQLLNGIYVDVDSAATEITITSVGVCTTSLLLYITGQTTSTTSTTSTSTTTTVAPTTTTTFAPVSFTLNYSCLSGLGYVTADLLLGGGGLYQVSNQLYTSYGAAFAGTFIDASQISNSYSATGDGVYYVSVRDKNNTSNFIINSVNVNCATTTTTTAAPTTTSTTSTSTSTTTTIAPIPFTLSYDLSTGVQSCVNYLNNVGRTTYYTANVATLAEGVTLYANSSFTTFVTDGYYSDGTNNWYVFEGTLSLQTTCSVEWYTLDECFGAGVPTTKAYIPDTFNVNDRVSTGTGGSTIFYTITTVHTSDPGGSHVSVSATGDTGCPTAVTLSYDVSTAVNSCVNYANGATNTYYLKSGASVVNGSKLYTDQTLSSTVTNGYYSDGTNSWSVSSGDVSLESVCSIEWYTLTKCFGSGTITTKAYVPDTFNVDDRVHTGTAPNQIHYTVTTVHTSDPGGSHITPISDSTTLCPTAVDYTISATCPYPAGTITVNGLSGGLGTYEITTNLYSTSGDALAATVWESITTSKDYTSVSDGTYYVAVRDAGNIENIIVKSVVVACTTTTTTQPPTTTTTQPPTTTTTTQPPTTTTTTEPPTTTTTTTVAGPCQVSLSPSNVDGATACDNWNNVIDRTTYYALYSGCSATNGQQLYTDSGLTTLIPNGYYSNGTNYWLVAGGAGTLNNQTACTGPTTTTTTTEPPTTTTTTTTVGPTTYQYLGKATPNSADSATACSTYSTIRSYYSLKSSLASIAVNDIIYDSYPSTPTNGGGNWVALTVGGTGDRYSFQIDAYGVVTAVGGNCSGGTTTTTTVASTTTAAYDFYTAEEYDCSTCTSTGNNAVLVAFPAGTSISTANRYYRPDSIPGFVYKNFTNASAGAAIIMTTLGSSTNCNTACGNTTTTTTTTEPPTTTTTTTTPPPTTTTTTTSAGGTVDIYISNVGSLDIPIGSMTINGVYVDWVGYGPDFVISAGDNGSFTSTQIGTYDVVIGYGGHIPGQRLVFTDSANVVTCQTLNGSIGTFTITNATITAGTTIGVEGLDGICP